jgi:hypothetical protein
MQALVTEEDHGFQVMWPPLICVPDTSGKDVLVISNGWCVCMVVLW